MSSVTRHHDSSSSPLARSGRSASRFWRSSPRAPGRACPGQPGHAPPRPWWIRDQSGFPRRHRRSAPGPPDPRRARRPTAPAEMATCIFSRISGAAASTAGMSITSASPRTRGLRQEPAHVFGPECRPAVFPGRRGNAGRRHEEQVKRQALARFGKHLRFPAHPARWPLRGSQRSPRWCPSARSTAPARTGVSSVLSRCM